MQQIETAIGNQIGQQSDQEFRDWMDKAKKLSKVWRGGLAITLVAAFILVSGKIIDASTTDPDDTQPKLPLNEKNHDDTADEPRLENRIVISDYFDSYRTMYEGLLGVYLDEFIAWGDANGMLSILKASFQPTSKILEIVNLFHADRNMAVLHELEEENNMGHNTLVNAVYESSDIGYLIINNPRTREEWTAWFTVAGAPNSGFTINLAIVVLLNN